MPASEQTWYNQKLMHIVFGATSLVLTLATFWLIAKDHNKEWKDWQLADRRKDAWMLQAERDRLAQQYDARMTTFENESLIAASQPVDIRAVATFLQQVRAEDQRLANSEEQPASVDSYLIRSDDNLQALNRESAGAELAPVIDKYEQLQSSAVEVQEAAAHLKAAADEPDEASASSLQAARDTAKDQRRLLLDRMQDHINEAKRRENSFVGTKKVVNGKRTAAVSELTLLVGHGGDETSIEQKQKTIDGYDAEIATLTQQIAAAKLYRTSLEGIVTQINAEQSRIAKELGAMQTELARLDDQIYKNQSNPIEWVTRMPVLNALYDGNVRIQQDWLPDLTINYNFSQVARFDRCITCHRAIAKTAPGTATDPAYPAIPAEQREFTVQLLTPEESPAVDASLRDIYGLELSDSGIINDADVTVHYVLPQTLAAKAGLESGDVIEKVGDSPVYEPETVDGMLLQSVKTWGEPITLHVKRGLDQPFTSHPKLDLFLTDLSPHPQGQFGCTICHDGQGSGTSFKWASHTPNNADDQLDWSRQYDWFDNHHWIFPMKPARFAESNCLKCHHEKGGLEPSKAFPEPPAEKLVTGWSTIEQYGCFGCHEVNGYDGPDNRIGPDVRLEPNFHEAAAALLQLEGLNDQERSLAQRVVAAPSDDSARLSLMASIQASSLAASDENTEPRLPAAAQKLAGLLKTPETVGQYRKSGPSLRYVSSKTEYEWLYSWIKQPSDFRPSTKMPQFFGLTEHLEGEGDEEQIALTHAYEPIEIRAITEYLLKNSSDFEYLEPSESVTEKASAERGKGLFQTRGCLACHSHDEFQGIEANQGPELSRLAAKFGNERGEKWLYSWLREPHRYHARTKMPNVFLNPIEEKDAQGQLTGKVTDPAADIMAYLLSVKTDWQPSNVPARELTAKEQENLSALALQWLASPQIPESTAKKFLEEGIPEKFANKVKADERILVGINNRNRVEKQLAYVGRRTISKYGCYGCHDIPGFEDAKPIGAALAEWGRKDSSKLAFENIQAFLSTHGIDPAQGRDYFENESKEAHDHPAGEHQNDDQGGHSADHAHTADGHAAHGHLDALDFDAADSYFVQAINSHSRDGFLWQKLRYPRSYDYKTTANKGYNERLRMPKFPFTDKQREEVMTFVLGLVNEPPAEKYIYQPDARQQAIVAGRQVLDKYNCSGCHILDMERWDFAYDPDMFDSPTKVTDYPFLESSFSPQEVAASLKIDDRGMRNASLSGMPVLDEETGLPMLVDEDGLATSWDEVAEIEAEEGEDYPVFYDFVLWDDTLINGEPWLMGLQNVLIPAAEGDVGPANGAAYGSHGGDLARYLYPHVIAKAKEANPQVKANEAWGWLPPPLMHEGKKVQPAWLHSFLMEPTELRPAAVMRMPHFQMSSEDAAKLVDYFAAMSEAEFPYEYKPQQQPSYLANLRQERDDPLGEAMNIVTNNNYCVKCHGVADFMPKGDVTTFGPNLADVSQRLRPEYLRNWIANPTRILPYTGMPVNIPYDPAKPHLGGIKQNLFHGTSVEQLDGLVALLSNFNAYTQQQTSISDLVKPAANQDGKKEDEQGNQARRDGDNSDKSASTN